jgi:hypothetical protein
VSLGIATSDAGYVRAEDMLGAAWTSMLDAKSAPEGAAEEVPPRAPRQARRKVMLPLAAALVALAVVVVLLWPRSAPVDPTASGPPAAAADARTDPDRSLARRPVAGSTDPGGPDVTASEVPEEAPISATPSAGLDLESTLLREPVAQSQGLERTKVAVPSLPQESPLPRTVAPLHLELRASEDVWVQVSIDGVGVLDAVLGPGQSRSFEGQRSAQLVIGNAGGLSVMWNGSDLGSLGAIGQVRRLSFTPTEIGPWQRPEPER